MRDQFQKGLTHIREALDAALADRKVAGSTVSLALDGGGAQGASFEVVVGDKSESQAFSREEIEDSGEAIDAPVAMKVRLLVSHFVR
jgi:hypothetical protein